ncbi:MAG: metal ABC transporter substrate-binding protein [Acidimicrobiia bacterium]
MKRLRAVMGVAVLAAMTLGACGTSDPGEGGVKVVVTTSALGDLVSNVAGADATVEVLMPLGADPHSFSPSSQQVAAMNDADLVVIIGLGLEEGFAAVLEGVVADGGRVLELGPMLDPIPFGLDDHDEDGDHDHSIDPHVWMDPLRMAEAAAIVAAELNELDPGTGWTERGAAYAAELQELHFEIEEELSVIEPAERLLVTNHEALGYFADRYDFEVVGTVVPGGSTLGDPSSEALASLVATMRELGVSVIFAETTQPSALADAVARELEGEVQVVELFTGSLGEPGSGAETLVDMFRTNAGRIAQALGS